MEGIFDSSAGNTGEDYNLVMVLYNDEVIGSFLGSSLNLSVVGIYATIVIAVGSFLRLIFDRIS
jgi:hypothetical protein